VDYYTEENKESGRPVAVLVTVVGDIRESVA
jgi:hypothetical protein